MHFSLYNLIHYNICANTEDINLVNKSSFCELVIILKSEWGKEPFVNSLF